MESGFKPMWDARQEYSKTLIGHINELKLVLDQPEAWYKLLRTYFSITSPFIIDKQKKECRNKLDKIQELINRSKVENLKNYIYTVNHLLFDAQDYIIDASSHLLMQVNKEELEGDDESWLGI
jgi:hypothetical protein